MLAACGGGGGVSRAPAVSDIQARNLLYHATAEFIISGDNLATLDNGIVPSIPQCSGLTGVSMVPGQQVFSCTVGVVGEIVVQVRDRAGTAIYSKAFTVPPPRVVLATSLGDIVVELNPSAAPLSVDNFLKYVLVGYYSNTLFHRVIAGFVVQGGGFTPGPTVRPTLFAPIPLESNKGLGNTRGTLAMARTGDPNSATSQFYFNVADNGFLDYRDPANPGYAVFGKIVQGLDVMDAIAAVATHTLDGVPNVPLTDVLVTAASRTQ